MFCPNCGANNTNEQKFCRSCGLNLEKIGLLLLEQIPSAESANLLRRQKKLEKFGKVGLTGAAVAGFCGFVALLYIVISRFILSGTNIAGGIVLISFVVFGMMSLIYLINMNILRAQRLKLRDVKEIPAYDTGKLLEESRTQPASVTTDTAELSYVETKTRKFE